MSLNFEILDSQCTHKSEIRHGSMSSIFESMNPYCTNDSGFKSVNPSRSQKSNFESVILVYSIRF